MSYTNVYPSRINWENEPSIASPINATNLNKMDYALYQIDQTLETWDVTKANQSDLLLSVKSIDYDTDTGVFVFTWQNGTTMTVDLNIEKIPVSFSMDANGVITMTTDDGATYTADVGALIKTYTFTDSSEIDFTVTTDSSGNKTVIANIVDGSITGSKLEPNYLANCQSAANSASGSATAADGSAEDSEAWAVGTRDGVPVPSTDPAYNNNSKYWATQGGANSLAGLSDTDINSPTDGQGLVYNYSTSKWINGNVSSGSTITVFTNESSLYGRTVTLTIGQQTKTETFSNVGVAVFKGIVSTGTFTITSSTSGGDTATATLDVPYFGNYTKQLTLFSATVTVTFPYSSGATCTLSDGTTTLSANTSPMAFDVPNAGTWTATVTLDGQSKTDSATITTDGQTASITIEYGTINLTYDNEFRGMSITCTDNDSTITKTAPISGNSMSFYPPSTGTWTISGVYSGVTYTTTATVSSLSTAVTAQLQTTPNGSTITPTDDIQIWLNCAGIYDKNYTTLGEVLADTTTFDVLLRDSNACNYMARSTTWASTICADADAMARVGKYDYCSDKLLSNSTWCTAICNSTYFESVLNTSVPKMTGTTTPSGEAIFSTQNTTNSFYAWKAFDRVKEYSTSTDKWVATAQTNQYVGYTFTSPVVIRKIYLLPDIYNSKSCAKDIKIEGSNDGSTWVTLDTRTLADQSTATDIYFTIDNDTAYTSYRVYISNMYVSASGIAIALRCVQFYGRTETQTDIVHTAPYADVYYMNGGTQTVLCTADGNGVGSVDWSDLDAGTYTLYSTVAKNPSDLSADYSKSVKITNTGIGGTTEVWLMPDNVLYWWGYKPINITSSGYKFDTITNSYKALSFNTDNIGLQSTSATNTCTFGGTDTKIAVSSKLYVCGTKNGSTSDAWANACATKDTFQSPRASITTNLGVSETNVTSGEYYIGISNYQCNNVNIYALWYE